MIDREQIIALVEQNLSGSEKFLVDVIIKPGNKIRVFLDSDREINIDDCAQMSKFIEANVSREAEDYELMVSSAGIDHPYKYLRQYRKNIGRQVSVTLKDGSRLTGTLMEANDDFIEIRPERNKKSKQKEPPAVQHISFGLIAETKGIVSFKK
jgi:ribosome maturation factor RimP